VAPGYSTYARTYENMLANFETARDAGLITVPRPRPAGFGNRKLRREAARKHARAVKAGAPRLSLVQPIEEQRDVSA